MTVESVSCSLRRGGILRVGGFRGEDAWGRGKCSQFDVSRGVPALPTREIMASDDSWRHDE